MGFKFLIKCSAMAKTFIVKVIRISPTINGVIGIEELVLITCILIMFKIVITNLYIIKVYR